MGTRPLVSVGLSIVVCLGFAAIAWTEGGEICEVHSAAITSFGPKAGMGNVVRCLVLCKGKPDEDCCPNVGSVLLTYAESHHGQWFVNPQMWDPGAPAIGFGGGESVYYESHTYELTLPDEMCLPGITAYWQADSDYGGDIIGDRHLSSARYDCP